jgi:hypothetical protein
LRNTSSDAALTCAGISENVHSKAFCVRSLQEDEDGHSH